MRRRKTQAARVLLSRRVVAGVYEQAPEELRRLLPADPAEVVLRRTYAGRVQRQCGAWSWYLALRDGAELCVGSHYPVYVLLTRGFTVVREASGDWTLDPLPVA